MNTQAQNAMRPVGELTADTSGWHLVKDWVNASRNNVEILKADSAKAADALFQTQVTTRSPMGAIIYFSGGIQVDSGLIRILGSGSIKLTRSLPAWNKGKTFNEYGEQPPFLLVADDAIGGYFAINGGSLGAEQGMLYYFSPNTLDWEPLHLNYSEFLNFCFNGDINTFYSDIKWKNWETDLAKLNADQVYSFYPYLWTAEGKDISKTRRTIVPIEEQYIFVMDARRQLRKY